MTCLRNEQMVEGISVERRKIRYLQRVGVLDGQRLHPD